jgi:hypothetical protein
MRTFVLLKAGDLLAAERGWRDAMLYLEDAISQYGRNAQLGNALRVFRSNRTAEIHNQFAALFNGRRYYDSRRLIQDGLAELPGNRQLQSDLSRVEEVLQRQ